MSDIFTTANAKIFIGPANSTAAAVSDFTALTYTQISKVSDIGKFGDVPASVKFTSLDGGRVIKKKGTRDAGDQTVNFAVVAGDPGQAALRAAAAVDGNYAFKVLFDDMPVGGTNPTTYYYLAEVMSVEQDDVKTDQMITNTATLGINGMPVLVGAA